MSPDALQHTGRSLNELGVTWMSGPLALALEPRYDAHFLGAVGEMLLDPAHHPWYLYIEDLVVKREHLFFRLTRGLTASDREYLEYPTEFLEIFERAWQQWYAFSSAELPTKENEARFSDIAPPIARAISFLRDHQRRDDPDRRSCSYFLQMASFEKEIALFFYDGDRQLSPELEASTRSPRFSIHDREDNSNYRKKLLKALSNSSQRPEPGKVYAAGWDASNRGISAASGLLGLALFDYEREYYLYLARIVEDLHRIIDKTSRLTRTEITILRAYKSFWRSLWAISCVVGPLSRPLDELNEALALKIAKHRNVGRWAVRVNDLHDALFLDSRLGTEIRREMTLPDTFALEMQSLRTKTGLDYNPEKTPKELAALLDMLQGAITSYQPDNIRAEFFWWLRSSSAIIDSLMKSYETADPSKSKSRRAS